MVDKLLGGRYRLLERHAVGGMAALWRARDERTGELVALKRLHPYLMADAGARQRLMREADALKAVDHPSIIRPRDVIDDHDDPALVMEFAEGRSLKDRLASDGAFKPEEAVAVVATVADALAVAHAAGIVHRDVKPANILVEDSGAVHLVDFGIATQGSGDEAGLTVPGTVIGTIRYAAPERLDGGESTPQSDVWSLGAVLFELLTGRPVVGPGETAATAGEAAQAAAPLLEGVHPALSAIVRRAMSTDPADRYADAGALRDALLGPDEPGDSETETIVTPLPVVAVPAPAVAGPRTPGGLSLVDRAAAVFFSGAVAVILVVAVVLGLGGDGQVAPPPSGPPVQAIEAVPSPTPAAVTPDPEAENGDRGNGKGNGKGKGNDKDERGGD